MRQYQRPAGRYHIAAVLAVLLGLSSFGFLEAEAQQAASFEQLLLLVTAGDTVSVTESRGRSARARSRSCHVRLCDSLWTASLATWRRWLCQRSSSVAPIPSATVRETVQLQVLRSACSAHFLAIAEALAQATERL